MAGVAVGADGVWGFAVPEFQQIRDLRGVLEREKCEIGVLISMLNTTKDMRAESADAGYYTSPWGKHPKIQLLTVQELLEGKRIDIRAVTGANVTFKKAPKHKGKKQDQLDLVHDNDD